MIRIRCAEVWGGVQDLDHDVEAAGLEASIFARACEGGKGGDVHYMSVCGEDKLTRLALADVAGHGAAVHDVSQWLYAALERRVNELESDALLAELNDLAIERGIRAMTTAAVVSFYADTSGLYYAYAGHAPALVWRRASGRWQPAALDASAEHANAPLGVVPAARFDHQFSPIERGDRIVLCTDGVVETPAPDGEQFGETRLQTLLDMHATGKLAELKDAVVEALHAHAGGPLSHDDVTLLALEVR